MKVITLSIAVLFLIVTAGAMWWVVQDHRAKARLEAVIEGNAMYVAVVVLEGHYNKQLLDATDVTSGTNLNHRLAVWTTMSGYRFRHCEEAQKNGHIVDCWNNDFNVYGDRQIDKRILPDDLVGKKRNVFIWSSGPNGKNEWGHGDDVYWPEP